VPIMSGNGGASEGASRSVRISVHQKIRSASGGEG
jgi:hypothetical protein